MEAEARSLLGWVARCPGRSLQHRNGEELFNDYLSSLQADDRICETTFELKEEFN